MKQATSRQLYTYWNALRGERAAPARAEIDPGAIRHILADVFTLERDALGRARFVLSGTRCGAIFGRDLQGTLFRDLWRQADEPEVERMLDVVLGETAGITAGLRALPDIGEPVELELLLLPLRHQGRTQARLIGAFAPVAPDHWIGLRLLDELTLGSMRVMRPSSRDQALGREPAPERRDRFVVHQGGRA